MSIAIHVPDGHEYFGVIPYPGLAVLVDGSIEEFQSVSLQGQVAVMYGDTPGRPTIVSRVDIQSIHLLAPEWAETR